MKAIWNWYGRHALTFWLCALGITAFLDVMTWISAYLVAVLMILLCIEDHLRKIAER